MVLDTIEVLFAGLKNQSIIRAELRRLFRWLKDRGLTAIVTGERGEGMLTRYGLEEYVADCVILLDHRVTEQISTRRLRIVKYRGSLHGTDEYPFLMGESGISVLPITSVGLTHGASSERISSGVADLDKMMGGKGFFRGSSILVSGTAGTGKSSLALTFLKAACERGERALYFGFEESPDQIIRNKTSIGLDLQPWVKKGLLHFHNVRPSSLGLEAHLASMHQIIKQVNPKVVVMDPITNFISVSDVGGIKSMLTRLVDFLKMKQITAMFTHLSTLGGRLESTDENVSSIMDTWLLLRDVEDEGRRSYALYVLKSRGMAHSHEMREFMLTDNGIRPGRHLYQRTQLHASSRRRQSAQPRKAQQLPAGEVTVAENANQEPGQEPQKKRPEWLLKLYVAGQTPKSVAAFANLKRICETHLKGQYQIEVVDLLVNPTLAKGDQIIAVPSLVRQLPPPVKKIIGDLANEERVLVGLDLRSAQAARRLENR